MEKEPPAEELEETKDETVVISERDYVLQFGPKTVDAIVEAVNTNFKLFWDGSVSMFNDTAHSATNNKHFLKALFEMRELTETHQEPPITLMHGQETFATVRDSLMRIKKDRADEAEAERLRIAEERAAMEGSDAEESEQLGDVSSKEETTLEQDMDTLTDFLITDESGFTMKLL